MKSTYTPLNFGLGDTIDMLREHVNAFATEHIAPIAAEIDRDKPVPESFMAFVRRNGVAWCDRR